MTSTKFSEEFANIWKHHDNGSFICITTNGFVKKNGEAVMGAGIAFQAKNKFTGIAYAVGQGIKKYGNIPLVNIDYRLITLPTKIMWTQPSDLSLIESSLKSLVKIADELKLEKIYLPRPGCGNGKRNWEKEVKPICLSLLDHRFIVCSTT